MRRLLYKSVLQELAGGYDAFRRSSQAILDREHVAASLVGAQVGAASLAAAGSGCMSQARCGRDELSARVCAVFATVAANGAEEV
jgi:hypothetical protein